jgi:hypothetical protein
LLEKAGIDGSAVAAHRGRAIGAAAARFQGARICAIGDPAGAARLAFAAIRKRDDDRVAGGEIGDGGADRLDNAGALMPADDRVGQVGEIAVAGMEIGVAHARGEDAHEDFVFERRGEFELLDLEGLRAGRHDCGGDFHRSGLPEGKLFNAKNAMDTQRTRTRQ